MTSHNNSILETIFDYKLFIYSVSNTLFYFCVSVLTPYYKEEVLFSPEDLYKKNEDGISILFYLRKIFPGNL
jgi:hypothetical protein